MYGQCTGQQAVEPFFFEDPSQVTPQALHPSPHVAYTWICYCVYGLVCCLFWCAHAVRAPLIARACKGGSSEQHSTTTTPSPRPSKVPCIYPKTNATQQVMVTVTCDIMELRHEFIIVLVRSGIILIVQVLVQEQQSHLKTA